MVAQDAEYHIKCLVSLYNRARKPNPYTKTDVDSLNYGVAFSELVSYIEETRIESCRPNFQTALPATAGTADSFLRLSHVTRTRRVHQITSSSLYLLLQKAYLDYCSSLTEGQNRLSLEEWCSKKSDLYPQFTFWLLILQIELAVMIFVRAVRETNFQLYVDALTKIVPWFFASDHTHYSRWISVHLRDRNWVKNSTTRM